MPAADDSAGAIAALFADVFRLLESWRDQATASLGPSTTPSALDALASRLVLPELEADSLLIGAGFIAAPDYVHAGDVHFAWWLGPLDAGPIFGSTQTPTRLDLSTRGYADYLRDVRGLEWYATPAATMAPHVTGPYVDHLCTCDYIVTLTVPALVDGAMVGVVGADIAVRRLEREVLPVLLQHPEGLALVNADGRVVVSTEPSTPAGALVSQDAASIECAGIPLRVVTL
ncbi:cache domain-containing protein [Humibacter ginsenosidimutans]|uniref:Cache domain-containing protein n=1 Tax=Humibacter ginsenosidimutans TaxID=2599293 RepID=A0A5B8M809_9MICO|nr:cache domain-containing protein [Humibacter ginsenosidimutans]QDZ16154.1 hypothetical protein FPZ11_16545 [Humibacter ginsenosidimutans]